MIFKTFEALFVLALIIVIGTEIIYPIIANKPLFGSFRSKKTKNPSDSEALRKELQIAKEKVNEAKEVQTKVNEFNKSVEQLKKESDDLLK